MKLSINSTQLNNIQDEQELYQTVSNHLNCNTPNPNTGFVCVSNFEENDDYWHYQIHEYWKGETHPIAFWKIANAELLLGDPLPANEMVEIKFEEIKMAEMPTLANTLYFHVEPYEL